MKAKFESDSESSRTTPGQKVMTQTQWMESMKRKEPRQPGFAKQGAKRKLRVEDDLQADGTAGGGGTGHAGGSGGGGNGGGGSGGAGNGGGDESAAAGS